MAANYIVGGIMQTVGSGIKFTANVVNTYAQYKIQCAALKQQLANAQVNYNFALGQANSALQGLSHNEYLLSRQHNQKLAEIETAFVGAGVSSESGTWQAVVDQQTRNDAEELVNMRQQVDTEVSLSMLDARNSITAAENQYRWGKRAAKYGMILGQFQNLDTHLNEVAQAWTGG